MYVVVCVETLRSTDKHFLHSSPVPTHHHWVVDVFGLTFFNATITSKP